MSENLVIPFSKTLAKQIALLVLPIISVFALTSFSLGAENKKLKEELNYEREFRKYFQGKYNDMQVNIASCTNDFLAEYISSYRDHNSAQYRLNRTESLKAVDNLNLAAGRLSALAVNGVPFLNSTVCYERFSGGFISPQILESDKADMENTIKDVSGKAKRMIEWRMQVSKLGLGDPIPDIPK